MKDGPLDELVINLNPHEVECVLCDDVCIKAQGVPMRDGVVLDVNDPGEWGGFDACPECYRCYVEGGPGAVYARLRALADG